ncbi:MAG TPA: TRAP transporter substrate-binding protein DctP [Terricaulis sp.]|nr:TRAP transporter substrate-binding protein DctP [Terricaulis sp.]
MKRRNLLMALGGGILISGCGASNLSTATKIGMSTPADATHNGVFAWISACADVLRAGGWPVNIYANSSLGNERDRIYQTQLGLLEINETGGDEVGRWSPTASASARPFVINSYEHMDRFLAETPYLQRVSEDLEKHHLRLIDLAYTGSMVGLFTRGAPVRSMADLRRLRLRVLSAADFSLLNAWDVRGVQVAWEEVAQALQSGMVDAYLNPPNIAPMFGHGSVLDYFTDLRMGPASRLIVISTRWYDTLSDAQRATLEAAFAAGREANRRWIRDTQARDRARLTEVGIEWIDLTDAERQEWVTASARIPMSRWDNSAAVAQYSAWVAQTTQAAP